MDTSRELRSVWRRFGEGKNRGGSVAKSFDTIIGLNSRNSARVSARISKHDDWGVIVPGHQVAFTRQPSFSKGTGAGVSHFR
jgi:hypothetical protein